MRLLLAGLVAISIIPVLLLASTWDLDSHLDLRDCLTPGDVVLNDWAEEPTRIAVYGVVGGKCFATSPDRDDGFSCWRMLGDESRRRSPAECSRFTGLGTLTRSPLAYSPS